jgi:hypothetical protein
MEHPVPTIHRRAIVCSCVLAAMVCPAGTADGFQRSRDPYTDVCLQQPQRTVIFHLIGPCPVGPSPRACLETVRNALEVWNAPGCSDLKVHFAGQATGMPVNRRGWAHDGVNAIVFNRVKRKHPVPDGNFSTISYDRISGEILDADIVLDIVPEHDTTDDLYDVLVHEVGHALGLDHALHTDAVMYRFHQPGPGRRRLSPDDVRALCHVYPAGQPTPTCRPRRPIANLAGWRSPGPFGSWVRLLLLFFSAWLVWKRRRGSAGF